MSTGKDRQLVADAKKVFKHFYDIPDGVNPETRKSYLTESVEKYEGLDDATEIEKLCKLLKINMGTWFYNNQVKRIEDVTYEHMYDTIIDVEYPMVNRLKVLMSDNKYHDWLITDLEGLTGVRVCPYCGLETYNPKVQRNKKRFEHHMKICKENGGKIVRDVNLNTVQLPYAPHITKQPIYQFLLIHHLTQYFKPTLYYITYDFETLEDEVNEEITEHTTLDAHLIPFMVSSTVKLPEGTFTRNFCLANDGENFINQWIEFLFENAPKVSEANLLQYDKVFDKVGEEAGKKLTEILRKEYKTANVIGFNSGKFDLNLILSHLSNSKWQIKNVIGSSSQFKAVTVFMREQNQTGLRFIDIRNYIAGGTLDQFTKDFGNNDGKRVKSYFPYQFVTVQNWEKELYKSEPFTQDSFYSALTKKSISDEEYKVYLDDSEKYKNRLEYFIHYCNQDVEIMIDPIDKIINETFEYKVDMLHNLSLSSNASMIRYAMTYTDFDPSAEYPESNGDSTFRLTKKYWRCKCESYRLQDEAKGRDTTNNVTEDDYEYFRDLMFNTKCYLCHEPFTNENRPTLDRIDNSKGHSIDNVKLACVYCNCAKSNRDEETTKLMINLRKYAIRNGLPMSLDKSQTEEYHILREAITGGLSNVQHRINMKGLTKINKLKYDEKTNSISNYDTDNIMTHFVGVDFNSLYPSCFSSNKHPFIKYTGGRMYMPGRLCKTINCYNKVFKDRALKIINNKTDLFVAVVKGHIDKKYINEFVNFPPIFRNVDITTDRKTIGDFMYDYMTKNEIKTDKKERKLTQLLDTHGEYMTFSSYYLWYLMDKFHFIIDDIKTLLVFDSNTCFGKFANSFMENRQKAELEGNKGKSLFCKISLNGSYGYDAMNTEKYVKQKVMNMNCTLCAHASQNFLGERLLSDPDTPDDDKAFLVQLQTDKYKCDTCLQEAVFTLDNAKYWYLTFIYDFMYKCMDTRRFHFIEGDTDSMYWAIAGNPELPNTQAFQDIILDKKFYDKYIYYFAPYDFFCFNQSFKPKLNTEAERKAHEKKLLGLAIEKQGDNMIALCPKCYVSFNKEYKDPESKLIALKMKGVAKSQNLHINPGCYIDVLEHALKFDGENVILSLKGGQMSRLTIGKTALTGVYTKGVACDNGCCQPFTPI